MKSHFLSLTVLYFFYYHFSIPIRPEFEINTTGIAENESPFIEEALIMLTQVKEALKNWFWQIVGQHGNSVKLIAIEEARPFDYARDDIYDKDVALSWRNNLKLRMNGTCYFLDRPSIVEPTYGYAITGLNKIAMGSVFLMNAKPSLGGYLKYRFLKKGHEITVDTAVLFDGNVGNNYYHFFADVFNKLWLLEKYNIDKSTPLIIGRKTFETGFFQYLYKQPEVNSYNWLIQGENDFIKSKSLFFIRPAAYDTALWEKTLALVENLRTKAEPFRRLFLTRPARFNRTLSNIDSLLPILEKHGFEIIDPGALNFEEQVKLFSESKIIAGIHGAAFTNVAFTYAKKARVLEINASGRTSGQLYLLAMMLQVEYFDAIMGSEMTNAKFEIPVDVFEKAIERLVDTKA